MVEVDLENFEYEEFDSKIELHKFDILPDLPLEYQINTEDRFETYLNLYRYYKQQPLYSCLPCEFYSDFILSETEKYMNQIFDDQIFYKQLKIKMFT